MSKNEGVFAKGERLTASKLNDLAAGRPLSVAGQGIVNRSGGRDELELKPPEIIYIRLTEKDVSKTPVRYGWKEVDRLGNPTATVSATWGNMTDRKAKMTDDYAIELNNANLSVTDNYIYRAERSPATGEWLFFLRKKPSGGGVNEICTGGMCERLPTTVQFIVGAPNPAYTGPPGPVYRELNYEQYSRNTITGAVCILSRSTRTDNGFFAGKARSLFPHSRTATISVPRATGFGIVELDDVTADLQPYLEYWYLKTWAGAVPPGEACPRSDYEATTETASFSAKTFVAVTVESAACVQKITLSKGVMVKIKQKVTTVIGGVTSVTYYDAGEYMCNNQTGLKRPLAADQNPAFAYVRDFQFADTSCGATVSKSYWGDVTLSDFE